MKVSLSWDLWRECVSGLSVSGSQVCFTQITLNLKMREFFADLVDLFYRIMNVELGFNPLLEVSALLCNMPAQCSSVKSILQNTFQCSKERPSWQRKILLFNIVYSYLKVRGNETLKILLLSGFFLWWSCWFDLKVCNKRPCLEFFI